MDKKTCLITGATSGLGEALSKKLATKNYNLILVSRSKNKLQSLSQLLNKKNIKYISVDLSQIENIKKNINKIGEVDILINNKAGKLLSTIPNNSGLHKPLEKIIS